MLITRFNEKKKNVTLPGFEPRPPGWQSGHSPTIPQWLIYPKAPKSIIWILWGWGKWPLRSEAKSEVVHLKVTYWLGTAYLLIKNLRLSMLQFWEVLKKDQPQITSNGLNGQNKAHLSLKTRLKNEKKIVTSMGFEPQPPGWQPGHSPTIPQWLMYPKAPKSIIWILWGLGKWPLRSEA